jgi:hypothetical protein
MGATSLIFVSGRAPRLRPLLLFFTSPLDVLPVGFQRIRMSLNPKVAVNRPHMVKVTYSRSFLVGDTRSLSVIRTSAQLVEVLEANRNKPIAEIGSLDLA